MGFRVWGLGYGVGSLPKWGPLGILGISDIRIGILRGLCRSLFACFEERMASSFIFGFRVCMNLG